MTLIFISILAFSAITLGLYFGIIKPKLKIYERKLTSFGPIKVNKDVLLKDSFKKELNIYMGFDQKVDESEHRLLNLPFPIPTEANRYSPSIKIITDLSNVIDKNSPIFAGSEQLLLVILPTDLVIDSLKFIAEDIAKHSSQAVAEAMFSIKESFLEGVQNVQDPEILTQCVQNFFTEIAKHLLNPENFEGIEIAYTASGIPGVILSVVGPGTVVETLDPVFNLHDHLKDIGMMLQDQAATSASEVGDYLTDNYDIDPTAHFPIITLIFSGVKEIKLLSKKKTDIETSVKNIVLDVVGTGTGALVGSTFLPLLVDLFLPGVGTGMTIIGGILGGWGGRKVSNKAKRINLDNAISDFKSCASSMDDALRNAAVASVSKVREFSIANYAEFVDRMGAAPRHDSNDEKIRLILRSLVKQKHIKLIELNSKLNQLKGAFFSYLPRNKRILASWTRQIENLNGYTPGNIDVLQDPVSALSALINHPSIEDTEYSKLLESESNILKKFNDDCYYRLVSWSVNASNEYKQAYSKVIKEIKAQIDIYKETSKIWQSKLEIKNQTIQYEKGKLGH